MLNQLVRGKSADRVFRYEVSGLRQSDETENTDYPIRNSGTVFITVPYSRMNQEMQRIARLGGKIVNIHPVNPEQRAEG